MGRQLIKMGQTTLPITVAEPYAGDRIKVGDAGQPAATSGPSATLEAGHIDGLASVANALVEPGKGILAADETPGTLTKRFDALGISSTPESRRTYREMLFAASGLADFISGVILQDETIRQNGSSGESMAQLLAAKGIMPGIKVDNGAKPLAGSPGELVTEGLDDLRQRLAEYRELGARFAKWRGVIRIGPAMPSRACIGANAHALARYAALCQEQGLVPIVEPEVLMNGVHGIDRCHAVTGCVLKAVFEALDEQGVALEAMLLKPNMVLAGEDCTESGVNRRGCERHIALPAPGCSRRCARNRIPLRWSERAAGDEPPGCDQPTAWPKTLDNYLLLWTSTAGSRA